MHFMVIWLPPNLIKIRSLMCSPLSDMSRQGRSEETPITGSHASDTIM